MAIDKGFSLFPQLICPKPTIEIAKPLRVRLGL
jgi:hypothetical protein